MTIERTTTTIIFAILGSIFGLAGVLFTIRWYNLSQSGLVRLFAPGLITTAELCAGIGYAVSATFFAGIYMMAKGK